MNMLSDTSVDIAKVKKEIKSNYNYLMNEYRNEFFFKNTLFNKLVLGRYSLSTTTAFSELSVARSKADFVLINNEHGIVYEIKTDLDNLDRLIYQLDDYSNAFSEVYVVTSEKNFYPVYRLLKEANPSVGIIVLTERVNLSVRKEAFRNYTNLDHEVLFKLLRKKEYEEILYSYFGCLPEVKPVHYFKACLNLFKEMNIREAQLSVMSLLQKRIEKVNPKLLKEIPMPLRWLVYSGNFNEEDLRDLYKKLK